MTSREWTLVVAFQFTTAAFCLALIAIKDDANLALHRSQTSFAGTITDFVIDQEEQIDLNRRAILQLYDMCGGGQPI